MTNEERERVLKAAVVETDLRHKHARGCRKAPSECQLCVGSMAWFAQLPLWVLSVVLGEGA